MRKKINILIMPTDVCNMNCIYCFHNNYHEKSGRMTLETLRRLYDSVFASYNDVLFIWHGGEPLCMGLDFYKQALAMQRDYENVHIENRMQSNLTLLTDEMADFFHENRIGIGASYDGVENDRLRGNTDEILFGRQKIIDRGGNCGFIMVLSKKNLYSIIESYEQFKELKANFNINTYVTTTAENNDELELDADETVKQLKKFFDYWVADKNCNIHVDFFERIFKFILYGEKSVCKYNSCLGKWLGIRHDGSIEPCNRYFPNEFSMGNIWDYSELANAFNSDGFKRLLSCAIERRYKCQKCSIYSYCTGGCNNVALNENGIMNNNGTTCKITKQIYHYVAEYIKTNKEITEHNNPMLRELYARKKRINQDYHYDVHHDSSVI